MVWRLSDVEGDKTSEALGLLAGVVTSEAGSFLAETGVSSVVISAAVVDPLLNAEGILAVPALALV